eukprot:16088163-Heterocapsa_arctica.AAC.1
MKVSIGEGKGALIIFDFEAAFPSLSQDFLHEILDRSGLPPHIRLVIKRLYINNLCNIKLKGDVYE